MLHVPYKGAGPVMSDLLGGHVASFSPVCRRDALGKAGKLRALAVTTTKRSPAAAEVPTLAESGVPGFDISNWFAYFVLRARRRLLSSASPPNQPRIEAAGRERKAGERRRGSGRHHTESLQSSCGAESEKFARLIKLPGQRRPTD